MNIQVNDCVTILGHVGIIDDIATSENGKTLILWRSLKGIWNHHPTEWIDITDTKELVKKCTADDINKDIEYYIGRCLVQTHDAMSNLVLYDLSSEDKGE